MMHLFNPNPIKLAILKILQREPLHIHTRLSFSSSSSPSATFSKMISRIEKTLEEIYRIPPFTVFVAIIIALNSASIIVATNDYLTFFFRLRMITYLTYWLATNKRFPRRSRLTCLAVLLTLYMKGYVFQLFDGRSWSYKFYVTGEYIYDLYPVFVLMVALVFVCIHKPLFYEIRSSSIAAPAA